MLSSEDQAIIFSDLSQDVVVDGHRISVEIYRVPGDPAWILSVMNAFGTRAIFRDPLHLEDGLAWRAFERLVYSEGVCAFYTENECRKVEF